jgi:hypothetical protein
MENLSGIIHADADERDHAAHLTRHLADMARLRQPSGRAGGTL